MSSQKSEVLNVLFHFRNRLDVPSPPSPDGLPALETSSASSFLYASGRPQRSARTAPARLSHTRAASVRSRPHRTHEGTPGRSAARLLPAPDSRAAAPPHPYRNRTAASYSHALSFPLSSSQTTTALRHHCCSSPPKRQLPGGWPQYSVASFHITRPMPPSSPHHTPSSNVHVRRASGSLHLP